MEWVSIELYIFQTIWHIAKHEEFPETFTYNVTNNLKPNDCPRTFLLNYALDLRCSIEKYFKILHCKEIEIGTLI